MGDKEAKALSLAFRAKMLWADFSATNPAMHASSTSYFTFMSSVPVLVICISLVSLTGLGESEVCEALLAIVPEAFNSLVRTLVSEAFKHSGVAFSLSTITLLWTASKGAKSLRAGLNDAYGEEESRNIVVVTIISIVAIVVLGLLFAVAIYLMFGDSVMHALAKSIPEFKDKGAITGVFNTSITLLLATITLALCYTYLPDGRRSPIAQLPGAACAIAACGALSFGFRVYVEHFSNYTVLYGSMATVVLFLFWMYLVFYIFIVGAFINRCLTKSDKGRNSQ